MSTAPAPTLNPPSSRRSLRGVLILLAAVALWGSTVVVIKQISIPPSMINLGRFVLACAVMAPFARRDRRIWIAAIELSLWLFAAYATQSIGLKYTSVNRSAFITAMNVIFVPILLRLTGRKIRPLIWAAASIALAGCGLLCYDGKPPNIGDLWTVFTALTWAIYIIRVEKSAKTFSSLSLAFAQLVPVMLLSLGWAAAEHSIRLHLPWPALLYLGIPATAGTLWLQALGQQTVPPAQAAVIFTLEPVFAALGGFLLAGEVLGIQGFIGAGLIIIAAFASQLPALLALRGNHLTARA